MQADARAVAYELLRRVWTDDAYANLLLPELIRAARLDSRDAAFATEIAYGTLRWRGLLDRVVEIAAGRELERVDPPLRDVLRLGAYQLLQTRVPAHAAVSTSVDLAASLGFTSAKGFVNATLRRVSERTLQQWQEQSTAQARDELERLSIRFSHPRWQVAALRDALGPAQGQLEDLLAADNASPRVMGVSRAGAELVVAEVAAGAEPGRWSPLAFTVSGDPAALASASGGTVAIQDEGSQLVAMCAATAPLTGSDARWLDLCAGPGGKAALLASLGEARLTAVELQPSRAALVLKSLEPFADRTEVITADGTDPRFATGDFDRVLVDAPCTGLGVLRRRPESRWRRVPEDVAGLGKLQRALLANAVAAVRPGGVVAYATCSPHLAETEFVVEDLLRKHPELTLLDAVAVATTIPGLRHAAEFAELTSPGPYLRLWPHIHGTDGMFLALLRKES